MPSAAELSCYARDWISLPFQSHDPNSSTVFRILVAGLDDDQNGTQTKAVVRAFQGQQGIAAIKTCHVLLESGAGADADAAIIRSGQELLRLEHADVLVFGEVLKEDQALNLHFLIGERETGTANLEAAVTAYRNALMERTQDRVPLDWADTEYNLGRTLIDIGKRQNGTESLNAALEAFQKSLPVFRNAASPWSYYTQNEIAIVEALLQQRASP